MSLDLKILFEDDDILAINKTSGVVVHPFDYSEEETILDSLKEKRPDIFLIKNEKKLMDGRMINLGGIVHKLDRDTSGVMVITKNEKSFLELSNLFKEHKVEKVYVALVEGVILKDDFLINAPLGRNRKDYKQTVNPKNIRGQLREAITLVSVIKRTKDKTLVKLFPKTGRTHQLRAHMSYINHPIIGDIAYGSKMDKKRIMLHSEKISFLVFGKNYSFEVKSDFDFEKI